MSQMERKRIVQSLETLCEHMDETMDSAQEEFFEAIHSAIVTARVLASLTDEQCRYLVEHSTAIAECDENDEADDGFVCGAVELLPPSVTADAHRKAAKLFGGER
jgi:hypothetical protein